jgi:tripartite-type tricarboxylate transporter receptor subunit TctC
MAELARLLIILALAAVAGPAAAAPEPPKCRTVVLIVGAGVGSGTDLVMRAFADRMNAYGASPPFRVINRVQDSVFQETAMAPADGCTVLAVTQALVADRLAREHTIDWQSFEPVARLTATPMVLAGRLGLEQQNLAAVLEAARRQPDSLTIGVLDSPVERFFLRMLTDATGVRFKEVPFSSARLRYVALLGKKVDLAFVSVASAVKRGSGKNKELIALAVSAEDRTPRLPEVPTLKDLGVPAVFSVDRGVVVPKGVKQEVIEHLAGWFEKVAKESGLAEALADSGTSIGLLMPEQYARYFENLSADWRELLQRTGRGPAAVVAPVRPRT